MRAAIGRPRVWRTAAACPAAAWHVWHSTWRGLATGPPLSGRSTAGAPPRPSGAAWLAPGSPENSRYVPLKQALYARSVTPRSTFGQSNCSGRSMRSWLSSADVRASTLETPPTPNDRPSVSAALLRPSGRVGRTDLKAVTRTSGRGTQELQAIEFANYRQAPSDKPPCLTVDLLSQ